MADWPDAAELKQVLNVDSDDWETTLGRVLSAAIKKVKRDVGSWDEDVDEPDDNLSEAALRMAELMSERPNGTPIGRFGSARIAGLASDPTYQSLLTGHRRTFGIG